MTVMLAIPTRGTLNPRCYDAQRAAATSLDTEPVLQVGHLSVGANRGAIVHRFLRSSHDTLLMIDDDVRPPDDLNGLIDALDSYPIVAAAYPVFQPEHWPIPVVAAWRRNDEGALAPIIEDGGVHQADAVGTGCIAIRRHVLDQIPDGFKETVDVDGRIVSDDINFCRAASDRGHRIAVNLDVRCDHITTVSLGAVLQGALHLHLTPA